MAPGPMDFSAESLSRPFVDAFASTPRLREAPRLPNFCAIFSFIGKQQSKSLSFCPGWVDTAGRSLWKAVHAPEVHHQRHHCQPGGLGWP